MRDRRRAPRRVQRPPSRPHLDAAFDSGYITIADDGQVVVSEALSRMDREILSLNQTRRVTKLAPEHNAYLQWHRECEFERWWLAS